MVVSLFRWLFILALICCSMSTLADKTLAESNLKARFIHQFIIFAKWPESSFQQGNDDYKIAILGDESMVKLYRSMTNTDIDNRKVLIDSLDEDVSREVLAGYHVVFIRKKYQRYLPAILKRAEGLTILTITEADVRKESSAMINFINIKNKLRFAIDEKQAKSVGITFRSQLLRLAYTDDS